MINRHNERNALEGVNSRAEVDRPRLEVGDELEFAERLESVREEDLEEYEAHREDHETVGECAEGSEDLEVFDHAEEHERH